MKNELVRADVSVPAALEAAGVKIVEQDGYRAVMFPPELRANFNVLLPTQEVSQAVELIRPSIRAVELNADFENGPHFYNTGTKAKPRLAPTKTALETLAFTAGLTLARTRPLRSDELAPYGEGAIGYEATVAIRRPDGTPLEVARSKVWQPEIEYRKVQAQNLPSYIDTEEKKAAEIRARWLREKEFAPAKTESKAVLRAIRAALQIPSGFTPEQAAKPFIVVGYDLALDYTDPNVIRLLLERRAETTRELYGRNETLAPSASETASEEAGGSPEAPSVPESSAPADEEKEAPTATTPAEAPPLFDGEEPPEPEADPAPPETSLELVLPDELSRYAGKTISEVVAAGDETYLKWLASKAVHREDINAAAKAGLAALKAAKS